MFGKKKKHEYDDYFYGLVISKSKALLKYVQEHPEGSDYARKQIVDAKYNISKVHPVLYGLYKRALHKPRIIGTQHQKFLINIDTIGIMFTISNGSDIFTLHFNNDKIKANNHYELTSDELNAKVFLSIYKAIGVKKENAEMIDFNIQSRLVINSLTEKYTRDYP
ncbi:hypothetical protein SEPL_251 [Salmonella phage SE_PL]|uniref:hypothetical protein n=1 Tax=Salmonella enterica TaxID=28901 RepID=UPI000FDF98D1|nr:hypothetical protein CPT_Munch_174 [Salmonella phage Munch]EAZ2022964.1 hypothetical protein [Salmonella enterica]ECV9084098.1 hypothetical protein [Salmonella enterica subsp. enterica serovar Infantis]MCP0435801.1 hypothetical protein [Salmonella enterica subsp. enterica serovar Mbandaka]QCW18857.1 hypothetical protein 7t3_0336 [Salmonella phage 7t3]QIG62864.1 hypothetical protein SEPL_251 [Salmonella phage SE_PL]